MLLLWLFNIIKHTSWSEYCFMFVQCSSANIIHLSLSTQSSGWFSTWAKHRSYIPLSSSANEKNQASDCRERCGPISVYMFLWKLFSRLQHTQFKITFTVCSEGMMTNSSRYQCQRAAKCNREEMEWGQKLTLKPNSCYSLKAEYLKGLCTGDTGVNKNVLIQIHFSISIS